MQELENWRTKFEAASGATEGFFSKRWIAEHLFNLSEDEFLRNQRELFYDRKFVAALETAGEEATTEEAGGMGADLGGEELGGEGEGEALAPEEGGAEERTAILPAKRDVRVGEGEEETSFSKSKGKRYYPVATDKRNMGARKRSYMSQYSSESGKNTRRNTHKGLSGLLRLGLGIPEGKDTTYSEELKLFEVNHQVRNLITELESKDNENKTQQEA